MAVLSALPGAARVLAVHAGLLPQPDQLCGPFAAHAALHAVLDEVPSLATLALAAGTRVWAADEPAWRPVGATLDRRCWDVLPAAVTPEDSGTDAGPLARALPGACDVAVLAVASRDAPDEGAWGRLLAGLVDAGRPVGVVANLRTGPLGEGRGAAGETADGGSDPLAGWDVGHFVVLVSYDPATGEVGVADSYPEAGAAGWPPGCRGVPGAALARALAAGPGRGLLLLLRPGDAAEVAALVAEVGLTSTRDDAPW